MENPRGGMERCDCPRGVMLRDSGRLKSVEKMEPVIETNIAALFVEMLAAMDFFPSETGARMIIADEIRSMCRTSEEGYWLVREMVRLYRRWPGVGEMRLVYCSTHQPLDGCDAVGVSEFYPDGFPALKPATPEPLRLPSPRQLTEAMPELEAIVRDFSKKLNRRPLPARTVDVPVVEITDANRIGPAQIKAALDELHAKKQREADDRAREELGDSATTAG
jgi:hypothetical protein